MTKPRLLTQVLVSIATCVPLLAQDPVEVRQADTLSQALLQVMTAADAQFGSAEKGPSIPTTPAVLADRVDEVANALRDAVEVSALRALARLLREKGAWDAFDAGDTAKLLVVLKASRPTSPPERLAPIVVVLKGLAPGRVEVQLAIAETFGSPSCVQSIGHAAAAIDALCDLLPASLDEFPSAEDRLRGLGEFIGVVGPLSWEATEALRQYLGVVRRELEAGAQVRLLTAGDIEALQTLRQLTDTRRRGDQALSVKLLEGLRGRLQPGNPVYALLLAETYASWGPAWNADKAKKCCEDFLKATAPAALAETGRKPWGTVTDMRVTLGFLAWSSGDPAQAVSMTGLRAYAQNLLDNIKPGTEDRLVVSPDFAELQRVTEVLAKDLPPIEKARNDASARLVELEQQCSRAENAYRNAPSGPGQFQQRKANAHAAWGDAQRSLDNGQKNLENAERRAARHEQRLQSYRARLEQFEELKRR